MEIFRFMSKITTDRALLIGLATVGFGISTIFRKISVTHVAPLQYQTISGIIYAITIFPFWIASSQMTNWSNVTQKGIMWVIFSTVMHISSAVIFMTALRGGNDVGIVSSLSSASPVITIMLSLLFLGEQPSFKQAVGVALILFGVIFAAK